MTLFALFSAFAASWRVCYAAPLTPLPEHDVGGAATTEEVPLQSDAAASSSELLPPPEESDEDENLDISQRLSGSDAPVPVNYILSQATGHFVAITKSGRVQANTQFGKSLQFTAEILCNN